MRVYEVTVLLDIDQQTWEGTLHASVPTTHEAFLAVMTQAGLDTAVHVRSLDLEGDHAFEVVTSAEAVEVIGDGDWPLRLWQQGPDGLRMGTTHWLCLDTRRNLGVNRNGDT